MEDTHLVSGMMHRCSVLAESMLPPEVDAEESLPTDTTIVAPNSTDRPQVLHTRDELFASQRARSSLSNELYRCQLKLAQALEELASHNANARSEHVRILELQTEYDSLREQLSDKEQCVVELRSKSEGQQALIQELRLQKTKLEAQVTSLECQRTETLGQPSCQQCDSTKQEIEVLRTTLRTAQSEAFKLTCEVDSLSIKIESQQAVINSDQLLKEKLATNMAKYEQHICDFKLRLRIAEEEARRKACETTTQLEVRLADSLQELDKARKSIVSLTATNRLQAQAINDLRRGSIPVETGTTTLETKLFDYRSDIERMQKYIESLEAHVARLIRQPEKHRNIASLLRNHKQTEDELNRAVTTLEKTKLEYAEKHNDEVARLKQMYENELQQSQSKAQERCHELEEEAKVLRAAYADLEQKLAAQMSDRTLIECQLHSTTNEVNSLRKNLDDAIKNVKAQSMQLATVTSDHMKLLYEFSRAKSELEFLKGQFEKEREHSELLRQEVAKQSAERDDLYLNCLPRLENQISKLEIERSSLRDTVKELEQMKRLQHHRITSLQERITELAVTASSTLDTGDKQAIFDQYIDTLRHAVETTALETKDLKERLVQTELERDHLAKLVTSVDQRIKSAKQSLTEENEELLSQRNTLVNEQSALKQSYDALVVQSAELDGTIKDLRSQIAIKDAQINELQNQTHELSKKACTSPEMLTLRKQLENMKISHMQLRKRLSERTSIAPETVRDILKPVLTLALCDRRTYKLP